MAGRQELGHNIPQEDKIKEVANQKQDILPGDAQRDDIPQQALPQLHEQKSHQQSLQHEAQYLIFPQQEGKAKVSNKDGNHIQRPRIYEEGSTSDRSRYRINVDLHTCVHGVWDQESKDPASLIIFKSQLVCVKGKGRFNSMELGFKLYSKDGGFDVESANPNVVDYAPFQETERENVATQKFQQATEKGAKLGANCHVKTDAYYKKGLNTQYEELYYDQGSASQYYDENTGRYNGAWWTLKRSINPHSKEGIRSNFRAAMLIRRNKEAPKALFEGKFELDVDCGLWKKYTKKWNEFRGHSESNDPIKFDPMAPAQGHIAGIDEKCLGKWQGRLVELVQLPGPRTSPVPSTPTETAQDQKDDTGKETGGDDEINEAENEVDDENDDDGDDGEDDDDDDDEWFDA